LNKNIFLQPYAEQRFLKEQQFQFSNACFIKKRAFAVFTTGIFKVQQAYFKIQQAYFEIQQAYLKIQLTYFKIQQAYFYLQQEYVGLQQRRFFETYTPCSCLSL
jgi:hypothetical protein